MTDTLTKKERSKRMSLIHDKDTKPEMLVRRMVYGLGFRYRLHVKSLPGKPDLVFKGRRKVIFVHGCFWHRHENCKLARLPKSKINFWTSKLEANKARDEKNLHQLQQQGWGTMVIWECELDDTEKLKRRVLNFLSGE